LILPPGKNVNSVPDSIEKIREAVARLDALPFGDDIPVDEDELELLQYHSDDDD
jgi:hypothetical protein